MITTQAFQSSSIILNLFKRLKSLQNFIYPYACLECHSYLDDLSGLCGSCAKKLNYIMDNYCCHCGIPFELQIGNTLSCAECFKNPPQYTQARSLFYYQENIKNLILKLKYADAHYVVPFLAKQMTFYMQANHTDADYMIPVPSHYRKLWQRKYNPVAILVDEMTHMNKIPVLMRGLKRIKHNSQKGATKIQRENHLKNAFICPDFIKPIIKDKNMLLIDDVMTTGATLKSCTKTLLKAGVKSVKILTLARVTLQNHSLDIDF